MLSPTLADLNMVAIDDPGQLLLGIVLAGIIIYYLFDRDIRALLKGHDGSGTVVAGLSKSRSILEKIDELDRNCVILYGSQTGTAEDFASRLAKEGKRRFGLRTMVGDLDDYDYETLSAIPGDKIVMFILATYGEGEPTDNAADFYNFILGERDSYADNYGRLGHLNYVTFGLGNKTYEHYNEVARRVGEALKTLGAHRVGDAGEGDDGAGSMEEDFLSWKDGMWKAVATKMGLEERNAGYEPTIEVVECASLTKDDDAVFLGEPNKMHLEGNVQHPFNAHNPYIAPIAESRELFTVQDRNCLHLDIDVSGSNISYQAGDHVAIWPTNPSVEVDRFLDVLGLVSKRDQVISVNAVDDTAKVPFPTPTTFDVIARFHLEICFPVSRQFVATIAKFAPTADAKTEMTRLGNDREYFHQKVGSQCHNIARLLFSVSNGVRWTSLPFSAMIEGLNKLQPRYYSISSSSLVQPKKISITAVVESRRLPGRNEYLYGVATNFLLALKQQHTGDTAPLGQTYDIFGPRNKYNGACVPIHIRRSNFKLPSDVNRPIIMVGPGTGVAPFRGFVQERAKQAQDGADVGTTMLFFGCRKSDEDYIYESEWRVGLLSLYQQMFWLIRSAEP